MDSGLEKEKELIDSINSFYTCLTRVSDTYRILSEKLSKVDLEQEDLLHTIEDGSFSACIGYKLAKQLHDLRVRRRIIKNKMRIIESVKTFQMAHGGQVIKDMEKLCKNLERIQVTIDNPIYTPRINNQQENNQLN